MLQLVYFCLERPPSKESMPLKGLIEMHEYDRLTEVPSLKKKIWGYGIYTRELTKEEEEQYGLSQLNDE